MPNNFTDWLRIIASIITIVSFTLYIREKHKRERQSDLMLGFLYGIKTLVKGMAQASDESRHKVIQ